jgi:hypothetical protein
MAKNLISGGDMTLAKMKSKIPQGGLLNPGLRHISTNIAKLHPMQTPKSGKFGNVLGKRK